jgi:hypothetical protein
MSISTTIHNSNTTTTDDLKSNGSMDDNDNDLNHQSPNDNNNKKRSRSETTDADTVGANITGDNNNNHNHNNKYKSEYAASVAAASAPSLKPLFEESLYGMVDGLPRTELKLIVEEARECEKALEEELKLLTQALQQEQKKSKVVLSTEKDSDGSHSHSLQDHKDWQQSPVAIMLESEVTPPDHYWSVSALLGRLRHDLKTPLPPNSQLRPRWDAPPVFKKRKSNNGTGGSSAAAGTEDGTASGRSTPNFAGIFNTADVSQFERLQQIQNHPNYKVEHDNTDKLLAVWKRISTHRSSLVFRRPVNPKDAPGYSDRILFPMDLSLIRKLIVNRTIRSYYHIAQRIHLIGHNCVKYNGRESDYAVVTRDFESCCTEYLINATLNHSNPTVVTNNPVGRPGKKRSDTPITTIQSNVIIISSSKATTTTISSKEDITQSSTETQSHRADIISSDGTSAPQTMDSFDAPMENSTVPVTSILTTTTTTK